MLSNYYGGEQKVRIKNQKPPTDWKLDGSELNKQHIHSLEGGLHKRWAQEWIKAAACGVLIAFL